MTVHYQRSGRYTPPARYTLLTFSPRRVVCSMSSEQPLVRPDLQSGDAGTLDGALQARGDVNRDPQPLEPETINRRGATGKEEQFLVREPAEPLAPVQLPLVRALHLLLPVRERVDGDRLSRFPHHVREVEF